MQHSVKYIGEKYQELSIMRNEKKQFNSIKFFEFAKDNCKKYNIIQNDSDLLVSTWYSDSLISDYQKTIK